MFQSTAYLQATRLYPFMQMDEDFLLLYIFTEIVLVTLNEKPHIHAIST